MKGYSLSSVKYSLTSLEKKRLNIILKEHPNAKPRYIPLTEIGYKIIVIENNIEIDNITDTDSMIKNL